MPEPEDKRARIADPSGVKRPAETEPDELRGGDKTGTLLEIFELEDCPEVQIPLAKLKRAMHCEIVDRRCRDEKLIQAFGENLTFEPARFSKACNRFGTVPGTVLDVRLNLDFREQSDRDVVLEQIKWERPMLILGADRGSPKCKHPEHVKFLNELYKNQAERGGLFVHEQANRSKLKDSPSVVLLVDSMSTTVYLVLLPDRNSVEVLLFLS